jgi:phosphopantetheinyl transferase
MPLQKIGQSTSNTDNKRQFDDIYSAFYMEENAILFCRKESLLKRLGKNLTLSLEKRSYNDFNWQEICLKTTENDISQINAVIKC